MQCPSSSPPSSLIFSPSFYLLLLLLQITHIYQMDKMGYNLVVHPQGFLVHRPHPPSAGYNNTFTGPAYTRGHKPTEVRALGMGRGCGLGGLP